MSNSQEQATFEVKELSRNAIRDICDKSKAADLKNETFIVQAIEVKTFTEKDNKKNIKSRYFTYSLIILGCIYQMVFQL